MISNIEILQNASPTVASPTPFAVVITFNTNLKSHSADIASVVANWGTTPAFGNTATGAVLRENSDGTLTAQVSIQADQSVPANYFQLLVTATDASTDTDGLSLFSTRDFCASMRALWEKQFQGLTGWDAITRIFGYRMNQAHTAILQVGGLRSLALAQGAQLDLLGVRLQQARESLSDSDYRDVLLSRVISLNGNATPEDLINIGNLIGRPGLQVMSEVGNARIRMAFVNSNPVVSLADLKASLMAAKLAGVNLEALAGPTPIFRYDGIAGPSVGGYDQGKYLAEF